MAGSIPSNWKVYSAASTFGKAYYYDASGFIYTNKVFKEGLETDTFEAKHSSFAKAEGSGEPLKSGGPRLGENNQPIDFAIIFYDLGEPGFKKDSEIVEATLRAKHPNIVIKKVELPENCAEDAFKKAFNDLADSCKNKPGKERVLCYYSGHGTLSKKKIAGNVQFIQPDHCFSEVIFKDCLAKLNNEIAAGWFIAATCKSGALTR